MSSDRIHDVVIVGGGPVGMALAIELGQRGITCAVVERHATPQPVPKGQNLTQRTMEHFHFWGAEDAVRAARTSPPGADSGGMMCYRSILSGYDYDWLSRGRVRDYYYTDNQRLPQYATEEVLRDRAAQIDTIDILYGWAGEDVTDRGDHVEVVIRPHEGGDADVLHGRYAVGCDGSRSAIRDAAGITQTKSEHDKLMVLLVFRSPELHELLSVKPPKSVYCALDPALKGYWKFLGRVDLGTTWFFHAPVPSGTTRDNFDFRAHLHEAVGAEFPVEFLHVGFWDLRVAIADSYRNRRVFIAGDAAHSHPPYGGYGINTGFEDAANLGWKIAATLQGWGGDALLDSYDAERRPVFASTARDFIEAFIDKDREFLDTYSPEKDRDAFEKAWSGRNAEMPEVMAFEPNYEGSPIVFGPPGAICSALGSHSFTARAGHHLAPQPLSAGRNVYEALGPGFTLLALDAAPETVAGFERAARAAGVPLAIVTDSRDGGRERYEAELLLIRPDQFIAWAGAAADADPAAIIARARGAA